MPEPVAFVLALAAGGFLLSPVIIVRMYIQHRERLAALKNRQEGAPGVVEEIAALRREMAQLRETTTHYDLSFDAALTRVESRLHDLEDDKRTASVRQEAPAYRATPTQESDVVQALNARR